MKRDPLLEFSQSSLLEPLTEFEDFYCKRMFGGLAVYVHGLMVLVLMEDPTQREWKGQTWPFAIWNGLLVPTDRERQPALVADLPALVPHPVLGKWLYLPLEHRDYENSAQSLIDWVCHQDSRIGIVPGEKKKTHKGRATIKNKKGRLKSKRPSSSKSKSAKTRKSKVR